VAREIVPNTHLQAARKGLLSPSGSGRPMSRQELADVCNAALASMYAKQGRRQRWAGLTEKTLGTLERGEIRWPNAALWRPGGESEPPQASLRHDRFDSPSGWRTWLRSSVLSRDHRHVALPIHKLESALLRGNLAYQGARYSELRQLPALIGGAESLFAEQPSTVDVSRVARAASGAYLLASKLAVKLGDGELAWTTADRARCFGLIAVDPALTAIAAYQTACALAKQPGRAAEAEEVAVTAADAIARDKLHRTPAYLSPTRCTRRRCFCARSQKRISLAISW